MTATPLRSFARKLAGAVLVTAASFGLATVAASVTARAAATGLTPVPIIVCPLPANPDCRIPPHPGGRTQVLERNGATLANASGPLVLSGGQVVERLLLLDLEPLDLGATPSIPATS